VTTEWDCTRFSPDGKRLATASQDPKVWDVETGEEILTLRGHTLLVFGVAFSPDGKWLASASADKTVKVWDASTRQEERTLRHRGGVVSVCFSPDGKQLVTAAGGGQLGRTGEVKVWNADTGQVIRTLKGHTGIITSVCFSRDGKRLAGGGTGSPTIQKIEPGEVKMQLSGEVKVWDAETGRETRTFPGHTSFVSSVCFSPDGKRLASASDGVALFNPGKPGEVKVWDVETGREVLSLKGHTAWHVWSVCFSPDGKRLVTASSESGKPREVKVWDAETGREVYTLEGHAACVCFSPDGKRLVTASSDLKVWDAETGQELVTVKEHTNVVNTMCFSPDGQRLATGGQDSTVRLWDVEKGWEVLTLKGHTGGVRSVCFSPDGQRLASASEDQTVKVWVAQGKGMEDSHGGQPWGQFTEVLE